MEMYKIDENGYYLKPFKIEKDIEKPIDCVSLPPPEGLYRAKWTGIEWTEDMTQKEIDELNNQPREFTQEDYILDIDFRLSMIELGL